MAEYTSCPVVRQPKELYYLGIAEAVSNRSTCLNKRYGAIIVKDDHVVSTGYNGAARGILNCSDSGRCFRIENKIPRGTHYETCRSVHAEANAIIMASPEEMKDATMYIYGYDCLHHTVVENPDCCIMCKRMIINAGIKEVIFADLKGLRVKEHVRQEYGYRVRPVRDWISTCDVTPSDGY